VPKWAIIKCQMGRFNGILSAKKGDYYIILSSANEAIQWIFKCQMGDYYYFNGL
jgi:hypothetical protein